MEQIPNPASFLACHGSCKGPEATFWYTYWVVPHRQDYYILLVGDSYKPSFQEEGTQPFVNPLEPFVHGICLSIVSVSKCGCTTS